MAGKFLRVSKLNKLETSRKDAAHKEGISGGENVRYIGHDPENRTAVSVENFKKTTRMSQTVGGNEWLQSFHRDQRVDASL